MPRKIQFIFVLILLGVLLTATQSGFAQSVNGPLNFGNNYFVTGDYVVAGAQGMTQNFSNGYAVGTIAVPDGNPGITGARAVPQGAEVIAAFLYWQTVEKTGTVPGQAGSGENGYFMPLVQGGPKAPGYPISGVDLASNDTVAFSSGGCTGASTGKLVRTYRANVLGALPRDSSGNISANGYYAVYLPSVGNNAPLTLGASLVLVYRILSSTVPLNSIVIYDGAYAPSTSALTMKQTMQGYYDAAANPVSRLTHIVGGGKSNKFETVYLNNTALPSLYGRESSFPGYYGAWDNPTWTFNPGETYLKIRNPILQGSGSATTEVIPASSQEGCVSWGAVIVSTTVANSDNDGLLDSWKVKPASPGRPGYCDASVSEGVCTPGSASWVDLPGAMPGEKDVFIQLDYMCSQPTGGDACTTGDGTNYSFDPRPSGAVGLVAGVNGVGGPFLSRGVHLHINPASTNQPDIHAIPETGCVDVPATNNTPAQLCSFPDQPGVVAWKGGFDFIKNQLINTAEVNPLTAASDCTVASPPATCTPRFQPGKRSSWHYVLSAHAVGQPEWKLQDDSLEYVKQSGNTVTFTTGSAVGTMNTLNGKSTGTQDPTCSFGRVTILGAGSNPNLNGTFCLASAANPSGTSFTIKVGGSATTAIYTYSTDPNLAVAPGYTSTASGVSDVGGADSLISLGLWGNPALNGLTPQASPASDGQTESFLAGTFMHEIGHSFGLTHGGYTYPELSQGNYVPNLGQNCKPNFQSVMNYAFQVGLLNLPAGTSVPDYSGQVLASLNKQKSGGPNVFTNPSPTYTNTSWYAPFAGVGTPASIHCDGTPITNNAKMVLTPGSASALSWTAGQDFNFDGNTSETVQGYNDWANIDFRQIGATGTNSTAEAGGQNFGGGGQNFGGGGQNFGGGGQNLGGGGQSFGGGGQALGGGGQNFGGGGQNFGGGGEVSVAVANSVTRPPQALQATESLAGRAIMLTWMPPVFGQIGAYNVYRAPKPSGPFSVIATVSGNPPMTTYTDSAAPCNTTGYAYFVTAVLSNTSASPKQESVGSNTVTTGSNGAAAGQGPLTGCYTLTGFSSPTSGTQGTIFPITWTLTDDYNSKGAPLTSANWSSITLVANGPGGSTTLVSKGTMTALGNSSLGSVTAAGQFTFNWDTDPSAAGSYTFTLQLDSGQTQTTSPPLVLAIHVTNAGTPQIMNVTLPSGTVGNPYSNPIIEEGGTGPFTWSITSGTPPAGIPFNSPVSTGSSAPLSGTACVAGTSNFTVMVADSKSNSGSRPLTLTIQQATTSVGVKSSLNPSLYGQAVTFTATVTPQYNGCAPTGSVQFVVDGANFGSPVAVSGAGPAVTATSGPLSSLNVVGSAHTVTAKYINTDGNFASSSGSLLGGQTVKPAPTATTVTSSVNPSTYGQSVTFTAMVANSSSTAVPTGSITFSIDSGAPIAGTTGPCPNGSPANSVCATTNTSTLTVNGSAHSVMASFANTDGNFVNSNGSLANGQGVNPAATLTSVASSSSSSTYGVSVTFTATVSNASGTAVTPTGTVTFSIDSGAAVGGTSIACSNGSPANSICFTTSSSMLTVSGSPHSVSASYTNTDGNFVSGSGLLPGGQSVSQAVSTTTLMTVSPMTSNLGDLVTLTAKVIDNSGNSTGTPTGLVTFFDGSTPIGTGTLAVVSGSDEAKFTTSLLSAAASPHSITAAYSGDSNFMASVTASATNENVSARVTTVGVALNPTTVGVGSPSTVTVTVSDNGTTNPPGAADTWIATAGTPAVGTIGSTATLFADGMVLVAGGTGTSGVVPNAYIYDAASTSRTFTATNGKLNNARTGASATLLSTGQILIVGGSSDGTPGGALQTAELYNPVTGTFTVAGSNSGTPNLMVAARFGATATLLGNGQVLIAGGQTSGGPLTSAELYDPVHDTFTATGSMPQSRYGAAAALLPSGKVLIAGGHNGAVLNESELYDPSGGSFSAIPVGLGTARMGATATLLLSGNVLVAGGSSDGTTGGAIQTAEIYNPTANSFSASNSTPVTARFNGTATALPNGMVLLVGGATGTSAELYDPESDVFEATGALLNADQASLTATLLNKDHVLITGLTSGGSPSSDAELYTPSFHPLGTVALTSSDTTPSTGDVFSAPCVLTIGGAGVSTCSATVTPGEVGTSPHTITGTYPADSVHSGSANSTPLTVVAPPAPPTGVGAAAAISGPGVTVTWTASVSPGVVSYNVFQSTVSGGPYTNLGSVPSSGPLTFTDTTATGGCPQVNYYYVVTAVGPGNVASANSSPEASFGITTCQ